MTHTGSEDTKKESVLEHALDGFIRQGERLEGTGGFPTKKHEEWRFVRLKSLVAPERYEVADAAKDPATALDATQRAEFDAKLEEILVSEANGALAVCINGVWSESLSTLDGLNEGTSTQVVSFSQDVELVGELSGLVQDGKDYFTALNDASWQQTLKVSVNKDTHGGCLHVVYVDAPASGSAVLSVPRAYVHVQRGSKFALVEDHISLGEGVSTMIPVVEVSLEENARCDHTKVQQNQLEAHHVARHAIKIVEGAHYASCTFHMGAQLSRQDMHAEIAGGNTNCELHGLALIDGQQVSDTHSVMNHVHAHAQSDQVHKCVVGGKAHAVFNGKIFVREGAQQIDAFQLNRNLLLSDRAQVDTKPQLEIFADDVKCSHGATIGQLDEDQLFYLQARGVAKDEARALLTYAFAAELVDKVPQLSVRKRVSQMILEKTTY